MDVPQHQGRVAGVAGGQQAASAIEVMPASGHRTADDLAVIVVTQRILKRSA